MPRADPRWAVGGGRRRPLLLRQTATHTGISARARFPGRAANCRSENQPNFSGSNNSVLAPAACTLKPPLALEQVLQVAPAWQCARSARRWHTHARCCACSLPTARSAVGPPARARGRACLVCTAAACRVKKGPDSKRNTYSSLCGRCAVCSRRPDARALPAAARGHRAGQGLLVTQPLSARGPDAALRMPGAGPPTVLRTRARGPHCHWQKDRCAPTTGHVLPASRAAVCVSPGDSQTPGGRPYGQTRLAESAEPCSKAWPDDAH